MTETTPSKSPVLQVQGLRVLLHSEGGMLAAVNGVDFELHAGRTLALVGESGAGKSLTSLALMRLVGKGAAGRGATLQGQAWLDTGSGRVDLLALAPAQLPALRGKALAMIFQEPMTSLNPVFRVGWQIAESLVRHEGLSQAAADARALELLQLVGIPDAAARRRAYPHELSGGMRQRVMIAMALACRPRLVIADEPTTALDVTVQAQVLALMRRLQREIGMALLFVTHDLGVVAQMADEVAVMYAGRIVERAEVRALFAAPRHPYTAALLRSMPGVAGVDAGRLVEPIPGSMPPLTRLPAGCAFHPRCAFADAARCSVEMPEMRQLAGRWLRCARAAELGALR
ncbi:MAG: ABC transporter ATP-binding protein [Betaproteobacteria bacterium]|nr:ABC transporter ATP-binding protein [Betaproteobacteria bacterium]